MQSHLAACKVKPLFTREIEGEVDTHNAADAVACWSLTAWTFWLRQVWTWSVESTANFEDSLMVEIQRQNPENATFQQRPTTFSNHRNSIGCFTFWGTQRAKSSPLGEFWGQISLRTQHNNAQMAWDHVSALAVFGLLKSGARNGLVPISWCAGSGVVSKSYGGLLRSEFVVRIGHILRPQFRTDCTLNTVTNRDSEEQRGVSKQSENQCRPTGSWAWECLKYSPIIFPLFSKAVLPSRLHINAVEVVAAMKIRITTEMTPKRLRFIRSRRTSWFEQALSKHCRHSAPIPFL